MLAPQAKLWPASDEVASAALELLRLQPGDVLADYGCGNGVALLLAVQRFGCRGAVGYEINVERALATRAAVAAAGLADRVAVHARNALDADASGADGTTCVYLYLIARGLSLILPLLRRIAALQPARTLRVVSVLYRIPGERHIEMRKVYSGAGGLVMTQIYLYSIGAEPPPNAGTGGAGSGAGGGDGAAVAGSGVSGVDAGESAGADAEADGAASAGPAVTSEGAGARLDSAAAAKGAAVGDASSAGSEGPTGAAAAALADNGAGLAVAGNESAV